MTLNEAALTWTPYVMGRGNATNFELGPALTAIAPREEDEEQKTAAEPAALQALQGPNGDGGALAPEEANGVEDKASVIMPGATILESTEPNEVKQEHEPQAGNDQPAENGVAGQPQGRSEPSEAVGTGSSATDADGDWTQQYNNIPATRFVVFPPISARRFDRPRPTVPRPPASRTGGSAPRPRPRRPGGSARRSSGTRPKSSSSSRRKSGGTGRGPGRWPKGTKKSDYGNADSGPGLPPAWIERNRLAAMAVQKKEPDEPQTEDAVEVQTPSGKADKADKRNGINGSSKGKASPRPRVKASRDGNEDGIMAGADAGGGGCVGRVLRSAGLYRSCAAAKLYLALP